MCNVLSNCSLTSDRFVTFFCIHLPPLSRNLQRFVAVVKIAKNYQGMCVVDNTDRFYNINCMIYPTCVT